MKRRVAVIDATWESDPGRHRQVLEAALREAQTQGAELALLPELIFLPYFCQSPSREPFAWAEALEGPSVTLLARWAKTFGLVIVTSIFERRTAGVYHNTAVVLERNGSLAGIYRKMHIPEDPGYFEKYYFTPGDLGFVPIDTSVGRLGVLICWDQWFPEAARLMVLAGAQLLLYPTAIGWNPDDPQPTWDQELEAWLTIQRAHAIANGCPVLTANRMGFEADPSGQTPGIRFWGHGFVAGAMGEYLLPPQSDSVGIRVADVDDRATERIRQIWPFLRDRRIDAYPKLLTRAWDPDPKK
ncbi:MAG: carbon-nitrogen hydrolase [Gammaproteobacteria bacterium]